jgi:hypothetical protein
MSISLRESRREFYISCTMTSNNAEWEQGWFYLRNDEPGLPPLHRQGSEGEGQLLVAWPVVNTKNWYRKETDLWAEFGKKTPFGRKFSSKHSVKMPAVGSTPSFGRRDVCAWTRKHSGITWPEYKEGTN